MKNARSFCAILCITAAAVWAPSAAPAATAATNTVEIGSSNETLSNGRGDWYDAYVSAVQKRASNRTFYERFDATQRFGRKDQSFLGGAYVFAAPRTVLNLEVAVSPQHNVLPAFAATASVEHRMRDGFGVAAGLSQRNYTGVNVSAGTLMIDRYWSRYRVAYTGTVSALSSAPGASVSHGVVFTTYGGVDNALSFSAFGGRDAESVAPGRVLVMRVSGFGIEGQHAFGSLRLSYGITAVNQGSLYRRTGGYLGLRFRI